MLMHKLEEYQISRKKMWMNLVFFFFVKIPHLKVLSQLPLTRRFICGTQASSLIGASCPEKTVGWPPESRGHILTCLSQPPEKTVIPSSFQAEHSTCTKQNQPVGHIQRAQN
jgi:hypothetical protein